MARVSLGLLGSLDQERRRRQRKPLHTRRASEGRRGHMRKRREAQRAVIAQNKADLGSWPFPPKGAK